VTDVLLPQDGAHNFLNCDAWIIFSIGHEGYIPRVRPMAVYCADLIQRYLPQLLDSPEGQIQPDVWDRQLQTFLGWRDATCVFATTPQTTNDVVAYAGVAASRALLVPTLVDPLSGLLEVNVKKPEAPYILWVTNTSLHKNHSAAVEALRVYYEELGGELEIIIVGADSDLLNPTAGGTSVGAQAFRRVPNLMSRIHFAGSVSNQAYLELVHGATIVWHNVIIDNGSFVAFDAARAGRYLVSSDYPQMRYLCERYGVEPIWHPASQPRAAADALMLATQRARNGVEPNHQLRSDSVSERNAQYGVILQQLLVEANV
jgi:glycosyltransferase involved in cell wall biosynthesis